MTFQVTGRKIESADEVFIERGNEIYAFAKKVEAFQPQADITPCNYALINNGDFPHYNSNLAISTVQEFNGHNHRDTHIKAFKNKLKVPSPLIFLQHYAYVNEVLGGRAVLYDASGNLIKGDRLSVYAHRLINNCWTHLNARFPREKEKGTGFLGLDLAVMTSLDSEGNPEFSISPLEDCLEESCYAELESLNSQGFPTEKAKIQEYIPGKVIYFGRPYEDSVARFSADSGGVGLGCSRDPRSSDSRLGVFFCAEDTQ